MIFNDEDIFKDILIDCDVFRHLHFLNYLDKIANSIPSNFIMLDIVEAELTRSKRFIPVLKYYVDNSTIVLNKMSIRNKNIIIEHFNFISNNVGAGESACMSVARYNDNVIGSSNLRDISDYCRTHQISYLTTLDLLFISVEQGKLTKEQFDIAVKELINSDYRIPNFSYEKYRNANEILVKQCKLLSEKS